MDESEGRKSERGVKYLEYADETFPEGSTASRDHGGIAELFAAKSAGLSDPLDQDKARKERYECETH